MAGSPGALVGTQRIGIGLVVFTLATMLVATLWPFCFALDTASWARIDWRMSYPGHNDRDLVQNLVMLVPLGAGAELARVGRAKLSKIVFEACALGFGASLVVETLQIFEHARFPQVADVWRNGVGCVVGALASHGVRRVLEGARSRSAAAGG
jgi:hypothetical protein